jgi:hypothetical protein
MMIFCFGFSTLCLIEAKLTGCSDAAKGPAIINFNGGQESSLI